MENKYGILSECWKTIRLACFYQMFVFKNQLENYDKKLWVYVFPLDLYFAY